MDRIRLGNTVFEGENDIYLLGAETDAPTTLIDTGVATGEAREALAAGLAAHGVAFADVDEIFLTHWHYDHAGLAGEIQREGGATVHVHEADAPLVEGDQEAITAMEDRQRALFDAWGMPAAKREELLAYFEHHDGLRGEPASVVPFADGERFDIGSMELEVVHAPGHAAGLSGFAFDGEEGREVFAGDALLPRYTPNVGGADVRVEHPLREYLATLDRFATGGYVRAWPGHRDVIDDVGGRAREIIRHHRERTDRVLDVVREHGPVDAWTVSAQLFGQLEAIHILHGPGEAHAHLDHLAELGVISATGGEYTVDAGEEMTDTADRIEESFPEV